jgi:hypothetical protein
MISNTTEVTLNSAMPAPESRRGAFERVISWEEQQFPGHDPNRWVAVWIDVPKLDAMLRASKILPYVGFAGKDGTKGLYTGVDEFVRQSRTKIYMPEAYIERANERHPQIVSLGDGRHRFAWMRDHGALALPIAAQVGAADKVAQLIGTEKRTCLVTMQQIPEWEPPWSPEPSHALPPVPPVLVAAAYLICQSRR